MKQQADRIEELVERLDAIADPAARAAAMDLLRSVMDLYAAGLERILEIAAQSGPAMVDRLGRDDIAGGLLALHGIHPVEISVRVARAVDRFRTKAQKHGGEVELVSAEHGIVRLRLRASGCGSAGLEAALESAIYDAAPDLESLVIENAPQLALVTIEQAVR